MQVIKATFVSTGVPDNQNLNAASWHLIKLYSTTQGWEVVPGTYNILIISIYTCFYGPLSPLSKPGVTKVLDLLKKNEIRIGIISNMDPRLNEILVDAGLRHYFEFVLPSYETKFFKPQPDIFKLAIEKCTKEVVLPSECCHIGDSYNEDYLGALNSGWNAILVNNNSHSLQPMEWFRSFEELHTFLETTL